jgi:hypothetical protein
MSVDDERALRYQLTAAIERYAPGPVMVPDLVRRGRRLRKRRRARAAAVIVSLVAAAAVVIWLAPRPAPRPAPASPQRYTVTVHAARPARPLPVNFDSNAQVSGLVAYGQVNNRQWWLRLSEHAGDLYVIGPGLESSFGVGDGGVDPPSSSGPPATLVSNGGSPWIDYGVVRSDVAYLTVKLTNGQTLTVRPVALFGRRYASYVAFGLPFNSALTQITAYSARGELAYAIPFTSDFQLQIRWIPAGKAAPGQASHQVGSGTVAGKAWSERLDTGPWGICQVISAALANLPAADCALQPLKPGQVAQAPDGTVFNLFTVPIPATGQRILPAVELAQAAPDVSYLILTRADGSTFRAPAVLVGGRRYSAFVTSVYFPGVGPRIPPLAVTRWAAYDSAGRELGSGPALFQV